MAIRNTHQARPVLMAALLIKLAITVSACAPQDPYRADANDGHDCPPNMKMECYKRTAQPAECRCVTQDRVEKTFEMIIGDGPR